MVEITQHHEDSATFLAESVFYWDFDFVEGDVGCSGCGGVCRLDGLCFDAFSAFNKNDSETVLYENMSSRVSLEATSGMGQRTSVLQPTVKLIRDRD